MIRRGAAPLTLLAAIALAGCETTEQKSAQIAKRVGNQRADAQQTKIAAANKSVRILRSAIVRGAGGSAAVLELENTSAATQRDIPIVITAYGASGKAVYTNNTVGASSPTGELSLLAGHATAWWVDSNVLSSAGEPVRLVAQIGAGSTGAAPAPLRSANLVGGSNFVGPYIGGSATNASDSALSDVTVYAVALAGGRVVAAGQSLIPVLSAHRSTSFEVTVIGSPKGASPAATIAPGHLG
jgi:hypothetical protein